ncbi:MAG: diaminopimelate epimerase [Clostridia bacterium]|nr:MAG: diaminopimelate epimerase [Clostridia bacterium]
MHGLGNDFVMVDASAQALSEDLGRLALSVCDRHFGIGADGLVVFWPAGDGRARMRIFNADGSEAQMCGNAVRCLGKYLYEEGLASRSRVEVETASGIVALALEVTGGRVTAVTVDMGPPRLSPEVIPVVAAKNPVVGWELEVDGLAIPVTCVSMGNPHCVIFQEDAARLNFSALAPRIERHAAFPERTNVELVEVLAPDRLAVTVWERGVGPTLACGTGACAALVAAVLNGKVTGPARVELPGGVLEIAWEPGKNVFMKGPATEVFRGRLK